MRPIPLRQTVARTLWVLAGIILLFIASCDCCGPQPTSIQSQLDAGGSSVDSGIGSPPGKLTISFRPIDGPETVDHRDIPGLLLFNVKVNDTPIECPYNTGQWTCQSALGNDTFIEVVPQSSNNWEFVEWSIPSCYRMKKCQFYLNNSMGAQTEQLAVSFKYVEHQNHIWPSAVRLLHQDLAYAEPGIFSRDGKSYIHVSDNDKYVQAFASAGGMSPPVWLATEGGFLLNYPSTDCGISGRSFKVSDHNLLGLSIDAASSRIWIAGVAGYLGFTETGMPSSMATQVKNIPQTVNLNAVWSVRWNNKPWAVAVGDRSTIQVVEDDQIVPLTTGCTGSEVPIVWRAVAGPAQPDSSATSLDVWAVAASGKIWKVTLTQNGPANCIPIEPPTGYQEADINAVSVISRGAHTEVWALVFAPLPDTGQPSVPDAGQPSVPDTAQPRGNLLLRLGLNMPQTPIKIRESSDMPLAALWIDAKDPMKPFAYAAGKSGIHRIRLP